jgi:hypothetical protein
MTWKGICSPVVGMMMIGIAGCAIAPTDAETTRQTVLQYIGSDVGTAGPFGKGGKKELAVLSSNDRAQAEILIDRGAEGFLIFAPPPPAGPDEHADPVVSRIVFVLHGKIAGDFHAPSAQKQAEKPADSSGTPVTIPRP